MYLIHSSAAITKDKFDNNSGMCKPRHNDDKDCNDYNLIIRDEIGRINEILKVYRLSRKYLTMERFMKEYDNPYSKTDFLRYYQSKLEERCSPGDKKVNVL